MFLSSSTRFFSACTRLECILSKLHPGIVQAFSRSTCFHQSFPHGVQIALLPCHLDVVHVNGEHGSLLSKRGAVFHPFSNKTPSAILPGDVRTAGQLSVASSFSIPVCALLTCETHPSRPIATHRPRLNGKKVHCIPYSIYMLAEP